jgi:hypothetical protein
MANTSTLSLDQLRRAVQIREEIERLESELSSVLGGGGGGGEVAGRGKRGRKPGSTGKKGGKRVMSPEARERIAAAQRRRWAKQKKAAKE